MKMTINGIKKDFFLLKLQKNLLLFLPLFLVTGPFLSDLAISICGLSVILSFLYIKK